jgi:hypothetical protein
VTVIGSCARAALTRSPRGRLPHDGTRLRMSDDREGRIALNAIAKGVARTNAAPGEIALGSA